MGPFRYLWNKFTRKGEKGPCPSGRDSSIKIDVKDIEAFLSPMLAKDAGQNDTASLIEALEKLSHWVNDVKENPKKDILIPAVREIISALKEKPDGLPTIILKPETLSLLSKGRDAIASASSHFKDLHECGSDRHVRPFNLSVARQLYRLQHGRLPDSAPDTAPAERESYLTMHQKLYEVDDKLTAFLYPHRDIIFGLATSTSGPLTRNDYFSRPG